MKFALVLVAALAVVSASSAAAPESESSEITLLNKLSKWFSFQLPLFAPIRTTTTKRPAAARTTPRPTTTRRTTTRRTTTTTTLAPEPEPEPEQPEEEVPEEQQPEESSHPNADIMNALNELYNMEGLREMLPPLSELLSANPNQEEMLNKPVGELADPFTLNLLQSVMNYIMSKPPGTVNLDDPIDITADGSSV